MFKMRTISANAHSVTTGSVEMFFSYETMVGVRKDGICYFQRDGKASSRTTAKHITQWANGSERKQVTETELKAMVEV